LHGSWSPQSPAVKHGARLRRASCLFQKKNNAAGKKSGGVVLGVKFGMEPSSDFELRSDDLDFVFDDFLQCDVNWVGFIGREGGDQGTSATSNFAGSTRCAIDKQSNITYFLFCLFKKFLVQNQRLPR
jgi:hypothetical protein